jgi:hypothetical protein
VLMFSNNDFDLVIIVALDIWNQDDFIHKNYILNKLNNTQYNMCSSIKSAKAPWIKSSMLKLPLWKDL